MIQKPEHAESQPVVFIVDDDESMRRTVSDPARSVDLRADTFASALEFLAAKRLDGPSAPDR